MAVMKENVMLFEAPSGNSAGASLHVSLQAGTIVEILEERPPKWLKIRSSASAEVLEGWVIAAAVDKAGSVLSPPSTEELAAASISNCSIFGGSAHFQLAYAHMRSGLKPGKMANLVEYGPFGFTPSEWDIYRSLAEYDMDFLAQDNSDWHRQCLVSALRGAIIQNLTAEKLKRQPNADELALALMAGPAIAANAAAQPDAKMDALIASISEMEAGIGGIDRANLTARFGLFINGKTAGEALAAISATLQNSLDATRAHFTQPEAKPVGSANDQLKPAFDGGAASVDIQISDEDIEALAWVANSEVGHFGKHGEAELEGGLAAVVDTVINRASHKQFFRQEGNKRVPRNVQEVINQRLQFSAINKLGTWKLLHDNSGLAKRQSDIHEIVSKHVAGRLNGQPSIIGGATHFLNPFFASPGPMKQWGNYVVANPVAIFGSVAKKDVHYHGTAPGVGKPADYRLTGMGKSVHFDPDGQAIATAAPSGGGTVSSGGSGFGVGTGIGKRIVENCLAEWQYFKQDTLKETDDPQYQRVGEYWHSINFPYDGKTLLKDDKTGKLFNPPWSAAFISHIILKSGGAGRFLPADAHWKYVKDLVAGRANPLYAVMRPEEYAPRPGDIVHAGRESAEKFTFNDAMNCFATGDSYTSHSDFVIDIRPGGKDIVTIGGNVSDSVGRHLPKIGPDGKLKPRKDKNGNNLPWIAVLRLLP